MQTLEKNKHLSTIREVKKIKRDIRSLRSFFISMVGEDPEGNYKPQFIEKMIKAMDDKPLYAYTGSGSLLKQLKNL